MTMTEHDRFPGPPTSWQDGPELLDDFDDRLLVSRSPEESPGSVLTGRFASFEEEHGSA